MLKYIRTPANLEVADLSKAIVAGDNGQNYHTGNMVYSWARSTLFLMLVSQPALSGRGKRVPAITRLISTSPTEVYRDRENTAAS